MRIWSWQDICLLVNYPSRRVNFSKSLGSSLRCGRNIGLDLAYAYSLWFGWCVPAFKSQPGCLFRNCYTSWINWTHSRIPDVWQKGSCQISHSTNFVKCAGRLEQIKNIATTRRYSGRHMLICCEKWEKEIPENRNYLCCTLKRQVCLRGSELATMYPKWP